MPPEPVRSPVTWFRETPLSFRSRVRPSQSVCDAASGEVSTSRLRPSGSCGFRVPDGYRNEKGATRVSGSPLFVFSNLSRAGAERLLVHGRRPRSVVVVRDRVEVAVAPRAAGRRRRDAGLGLGLGLRLRLGRCQVLVGGGRLAAGRRPGRGTLAIRARGARRPPPLRTPPSPVGASPAGDASASAVARCRPSCRSPASRGLGGGSGRRGLGRRARFRGARFGLAAGASSTAPVVGSLCVRRRRRHRRPWSARPGSASGRTCWSRPSR
jgi:hypothetical protein